MEREIPSLPQEEAFQLVRDGFYVSSGSTTAHVLFVRYLSVEKGMTSLDALNFYNKSYFQLPPDYKKRLVDSMVEIHKKQTRETVNTVIFLRLASPLQREVSTKRMKMSSFYEGQFPEQLPNIDNMSDLVFLVKKSNLGSLENFDRVLLYISCQKKKSVVHADLKSISAYLTCFDDKVWFKLLSDKQTQAYKLRGKKIVDEVLK